jgi:hypothetical protein
METKGRAAGGADAFAEKLSKFVACGTAVDPGTPKLSVVSVRRRNRPVDVNRYNGTTTETPQSEGDRQPPVRARVIPNGLRQDARRRHGDFEHDFDL